MPGEHRGVPGVVLTLTDGSGVVVSTTTTDMNGKYHFQDLTEGTYILTLYPPQHDPVAHTVTVRTRPTSNHDIVELDGPVARYDIELGGLCELVGAVRAAALLPAHSTQQADPATSRTILRGIGASSHSPGQPDPSTENSAVTGARSSRSADEADHRSTPIDDNHHPFRWRGGRAALVALVVAAVVAASGGLTYWQGWVDNLAGTGDAAASLPPATAQVTTQTLVRTRTVTGTLGYGDERQLGTDAQGTVTWLAAEGDTVGRGETLYRVDELPVVLMYGSMPLYRTLDVGVEGQDVEQLERNLAELGYGGFTVNQEFTDATAEAVREWQNDLGLEETGTVEPAQVVMKPGPVRISRQLLEIGDQISPGTPALAYTGTERLVTVDLDVNDRELLDEAAEASVVLPDGQTINATIASVGTVARTASDDSGDSRGGPATLDVTISLGNPDEVGDYDQASVDVELVSEEREDVLTVPVAALLALPEGGYGVEVITGTSTEIVAVEVGMFARGRVEVTGQGIADGTEVGVPQ